MVSVQGRQKNKTLSLQRFAMQPTYEELLNVIEGQRKIIKRVAELEERLSLNSTNRPLLKLYLSVKIALFDRFKNSF